VDVLLDPASIQERPLPAHVDEVAAAGREVEGGGRVLLGRGGGGGGGGGGRKRRAVGERRARPPWLVLQVWSTRENEIAGRVTSIWIGEGERDRRLCERFSLRGLPLQNHLQP
jgi:hypothetical protein